MLNHTKNDLKDIFFCILVVILEINTMMLFDQKKSLR